MHVLGDRSIVMPGESASADAAPATRSTNGHGESGSTIAEARDVWFAYDGVNYVLQGASLAVERGAMTMVLGRSGSGKTTLLKVVKGLLRPQRGAVFVHNGANGRSPGGAIAYLPQSLGLVRSGSALDNAVTGALSRVGTLRSLVRSFPASIVAEARQTLARLGLSHKLAEPVYRLSGGERQRVAIARALMQRPSLILADEFVSQLDPVTAEDILGLMRDICRQGVSMLITTHETDVVANHADRIVVMAAGAVIHDGPGGSLSEPQMLEILR